MIVYKSETSHIKADAFRGFYEEFPNQAKPKKYLDILNKSNYVILAIDEESQQVVGFINAIVDNPSSAYIPLIRVLPSYQRQGIGKALVKRMLVLLAPLYHIDINSSHAMTKFYKQFYFNKGHLIQNENQGSEV